MLLSILVAATLSALATLTGATTWTCGSTVQCCLTKLPADSTTRQSVHDKLGVDISIGTYVWYTCNALILVTSGGGACPGETLCCRKIASDGSIAIGCRII